VTNTLNHIIQYKEFQLNNVNPGYVCICQFDIERYDECCNNCCNNCSSSNNKLYSLQHVDEVLREQFGHIMAPEQGRFYGGQGAAPQ